jgi:hypothetical protein
VGDSQGTTLESLCPNCLSVIIVFSEEIYLQGPLSLQTIVPVEIHCFPGTFFRPFRNTVEDSGSRIRENSGVFRYPPKSHDFGYRCNRAFYGSQGRKIDWLESV